VSERRLWVSCQRAYRDAIARCSEAAPWHVVPADRKWYGNWAVAGILREKLIDMKLSRLLGP
jgi:polyphosphate kinase 2 (PPK2 family)